MTRTVSVSLLFVLLAIPVAAQDSFEDSYDRFQLWTDCAPLYLLVEGLHPAAADIGLTRQSIETLVRSRLRAARIYSAKKDSPHLYINVIVTERSYSINFEFNKIVTDSNYSLLTFSAPTWQRRSAGTHGRDAGRLQQSISELTDIFVDEYLRVNADSCK